MYKLVLASALLLFSGAFGFAEDPGQQIELVHAKWRDAVNSGDTQAFAAVSTPGLIIIDGFGKGDIAAMRENLPKLHQKGLTLTTNIEAVKTIGDGVAVATGNYSAKFADPSIPSGQGNFAHVFERHDGGWKLSILTMIRTVLKLPGSETQ